MTYEEFKLVESTYTVITHCMCIKNDLKNLDIFAAKCNTCEFIRVPTEVWGYIKKFNREKFPRMSTSDFEAMDAWIDTKVHYEVKKKSKTNIF